MAIAGHGTILNYHTGSAYAAVGDITEITVSGLSREVIDTSALDDSNYFRTYISGRADAGEISFKVNLADSNTAHEALRDQLLNGAVTDSLDLFQVQFPSSGSTWSFSGFVTKFDMTFPDGEKITADIVIKISGKPSIS